ncbi:MAG: 5'-3' exonuclease H3TH domain-containing protein [Nitriliruptoraceae bacterium]
MALDAGTVLLVDGNSLGHRAFHSTPDETVNDHAVTMRFVTMLTSVWWHGPYDGVFIAFDHPVNRRKVDVPEYKANRGDRNPTLSAGLDQIRGDLADLGVAVDCQHGAEADDLLAAAADACADRGWRCDVLSSDQDLIALVDPSTRLLRPRAHFTDLQVLDVAAVHAEYGVGPDCYPDVAALRGDPSDGLDGAVGVGAKTAARLVREYGSVAGVYDALANLPLALESALRTARPLVERNLLLMAPIPHLEVDIDAAVASWDVERFAAGLARWDATAARRARENITAPQAPRPPMPPPPESPDESQPRPIAARPANTPRSEDPRAAPEAATNDVDEHPALF